MHPHMTNLTDHLWNGQNIWQRQHEWLVTIDSLILSELRQAILTLGRTGKRAPQFSKSDLTLSYRSNKLFAELSQRIENGPGVLVLEGIDINDYSQAELQNLLWALGLYFGTAVNQNRAGDLIGFVEDRGEILTNHSVRGHSTSAALPFHCDRCDVIMLMCVRKAREGGMSSMASAAWIHNQIAEEDPGLLEILYKEFPQDLRGSEEPGSKPWAMLPVFSFQNGTFVSRYTRRFIEGSQRFEDAPRLTDKHVKALDAIDACLAISTNVFNLQLEPGFIQIMNNHLVWHSRTAFIDWEDATRRRLLLRLWLATNNSRRLPDSFMPLYRSVEPGTVRGVTTRSGSSRRLRPGGGSW